MPPSSFGWCRSQALLRIVNRRPSYGHNSIQSMVVVCKKADRAADRMEAWVLICLSKACRIKAIRLILLICSFLLVTPGASFAFANDPRTLDCLTQADKRLASHHHANEPDHHDVDGRMSVKLLDAHMPHCGACGTAPCECYGSVVIWCSQVVSKASSNSHFAFPLLFPRLRQEPRSNLALSIDRPPKSGSSL